MMDARLTWGSAARSASGTGQLFLRGPSSEGVPHLGAVPPEALPELLLGLALELTDALAAEVEALADLLEGLLAAAQQPERSRASRPIRACRTRKPISLA